MKERLLKLSDGTEILLVLAIAFGLFVPGSLAALISQEGAGPSRVPRRFRTATCKKVLYEVMVLVILATFLRLRGWTLARLGVGPTLRETGYGVGLCVGYYAFYYVLMMTLATTLWPTFARLMMSTHLVGADLQWPTVVAASVINPVFAEVFVCGYMITALKDRVGVTTAVNASAGLRVFYHFYQGGGHRAVGTAVRLPVCPDGTPVAPARGACLDGLRGARGGDVTAFPTSVGAVLG